MHLIQRTMKSRSEKSILFKSQQTRLSKCNVFIFIWIIYSIGKLIIKSGLSVREWVRSIIPELITEYSVQTLLLE